MTTTQSLPRRRVRRKKHSSSLGWLFVAPASAVLFVFFVIPLGFSAWMSTKHWPLLGLDKPSNFPQNYTEIPHNELFMHAIIFTLKYTLIIVVVLICLSLALALLIQEGKSRASGLLRTAYFLPAVTGLSAAALLFLGLFNPSIGPLTKIFSLFGANPDWLGTPNLALFSTVTMMTWRFAGFYMVIMLSGLQAIPGDIYESAAIDGAGRFTIFRRITLPLLRSTISLCLILIVTGGMVAFEQFYVLTAGGPDNTTVTMVMTIFREAFSQYRLGSAAAMSMVLLLALVILNVMQLRLVRSDDSGATK
jgi:multiple sugar transport system permease protein